MGRAHDMHGVIDYPAPKPDIAPGLVDRLRAVRAELECTQKEMNELLFIGVGSWQRYECGGQIPGGKVLAALAHEGINLNWLLTGAGSMEAAMPNRALDAWVAAKEAQGDTVVRYTCPNGDCGGEIPALVPPPGDVYDTFACCPHCHSTHYMMVNARGQVHVSVPGCRAPVAVPSRGVR